MLTLNVPPPILCSEHSLETIIVPDWDGVPGMGKRPATVSMVNDTWMMERRTGLAQWWWRVTPKGIFPIPRRLLHTIRRHKKFQTKTLESGDATFPAAVAASLIAETTISRRSPEFAETSCASRRYTWARTTATRKQEFRRSGL